MKRKLLYFIACVFTIMTSYSQTISIVGEAVGGWPDGDPNTPDTHILSTNDNITYSISNLSVTTAAPGPDGGAKFRRDGDWLINWGGSTFPSGQGIQNGPNIPTVAGIYDVTINISNGTYTFIPSGFPSIGIWGPAVNSQLGFGAPDVDMTTTDGIIYTLSGFYFSSGSAYFRQDNASAFLWGTVAFPTGTAVLGGPTLFIPSGEWFVTFNRITGEFSFAYPSIGIVGTALNGWDDDTNLFTNDGFNYSISNLSLTNGEVKFRKDKLWTSNWGSASFPIGTGTQGGANIPVTAGTYNITFEKSSGNYDFSNILSNVENSISNVNIYPNPTNNNWNIFHSKSMDGIQLFDINGKELKSFNPNSSEFVLTSDGLSNSVYFLKVKSGLDFTVQKIIKN